MNITSFLALVALGLLAVALVYAVACIRKDSRRSDLVSACNTLAPSFGTHEKSLSLYSSAAIATRYLLGKRGADVSHVAVIAAASDEPIGVITDEALAAEELISVELLGLTNRTIPMVAGGIVALDAPLYSNGAGKVVVKPTAAGTYWRVGTARQAATADGDVIEVEPCKARKLIVIAALGNANGEIAALTFTAAGATGPEAEALRDKVEELADDVRAIAAALNGDADVALATT